MTSRITIGKELQCNHELLHCTHDVTHHYWKGTAMYAPDGKVRWHGVMITMNFATALVTSRITKGTAMYAPDGKVRIVVSAVDPMLSCEYNWIDTCGHSCGTMYGARVRTMDSSTHHVLPTLQRQPQCTVFVSCHGFMDFSTNQSFGIVCLSWHCIALLLVSVPPHVRIQHTLASGTRYHPAHVSIHHTLASSTR
jgi:hypothetical protein